MGSYTLKKVHWVLLRLTCNAKHDTDSSCTAKGCRCTLAATAAALLQAKSELLNHMQTEVLQTLRRQAWTTGSCSGTKAPHCTT